MRESRARVLSAFVLVLALTAAPARANHSSGYHWARSSNPFAVTYTTNVSSSWAPIVSKVLSEWDNVAQYRVAGPDVVDFVPGGGRLWIESGNYGDTGWYGLATIGVDPRSGHIGAASVRVNDSYPASDLAREHVLCQEVGHVLGLAHNHSPLAFGASCMDDDNDTLDDPAYRTPNGHDADQLQLSYLHRDGTGLPAALVPVVVHQITAR
jgi:hypothetical protein